MNPTTNKDLLAFLEEPVQIQYALSSQTVVIWKNEVATSILVCKCPEHRRAAVVINDSITQTAAKITTCFGRVSCLDKHPELTTLYPGDVAKRIFPSLFAVRIEIMEAPGHPWVCESPYCYRKDKYCGLGKDGAFQHAESNHFAAYVNLQGKIIHDTRKTIPNGTLRFKTNGHTVVVKTIPEDDTFGLIGKPFVRDSVHSSIEELIADLLATPISARTSYLKNSKTGDCYCTRCLMQDKQCRPIKSFHEARRHMLKHHSIRLVQPQRPKVKSSTIESSRTSIKKSIKKVPVVVLLPLTLERHNAVNIL